jgi:CHAD domain-containing protein
MVFPATVLQCEIEALLGYLPLVRDGDVESVHGARVMTRKLREALPLFARSFPDDVQRLKRIVKRTGRRLGRVREMDVMDADLTRRAGRMPLAQHAITAAHAMLARRRTAARRRLVKTLDGLRLDRRNELRLQHRRDWWHPFDQTLATGWAAVLRGRIAKRAMKLSSAIDHAGGVYFPNRLHEVRIAAKRLRYAAELAGKGGLWPCEEAVADLKRTQETLGRLHDAEMLLKAVVKLAGKANVDDRELAILKGDLEGEIAERHAKYLTQREQLRAAQRACLDAVGRLKARRPPVVSVLALSAAAAVPVGLLILGSQERSQLGGADQRIGFGGVSPAKQADVLPLERDGRGEELLELSTKP